MMKASQLRDMTLDEVLQQKADTDKEAFNLKIRQATRQLDNPLKIRQLRRDCARLNTILREHQLKLRTLATGHDVTIDKQAGDEKQA